MSIFKISIQNHPHFPNPILLQISNCDKVELTNLLKQYMYSWLWIKPDEINQAEIITELFYQKHETFPLKLAGYFWEIQELIEEEKFELDILAENTEQEKSQENIDQVSEGDETLPQTESEQSQIADSNTANNLENKPNPKSKKK